MPNEFDRAAQRGLDYVVANPGLKFEFNVYSKPDEFPPLVAPANDAAKALDKAIEANEGFSGAGYFASFSIFINQAFDRKFAVYEEPATRKLVIQAPGATIPKNAIVPKR